MLAGQSRAKGVKYCFQLLLNGWVISAILWCLGSLVDFIANEFDLVIPYELDFWLKIAGWIVGGLFFIVFMIRLFIYWHGRRSGKYL
ncbi:hypothetical protein D3C77_401430 [compost metagenome]